MNLRLSRSHSQIVSPLATRRGVALVITLILLAVISTLAIAFLGLTQRETSSVDSMGRTTDSEVAADSALERAKAEITAVYPIRNQDVAANGPNILGPDMTVSVCCQNYDTATRRTVPYDRLLNPLQRLTNRYDAAPPVFVQTNAVVNAANPLDDRFSVDLNRNGLFEDSGFVQDLEVGRFGTNEINWRVGDPQWIGLLQNPRRAHGPNNKYIGRYAFMILPVGRSLDLNWIHNDAKSPNPYPVGESGFSRNQGVGGFEINLAGFLADLNGDIWNNPNAPYLATPYSYSLDIATGNRGTAFDDAWQILNARYGGAKAGLDRMSVLFQPTPIVDVEALIGTDLIDPFGNARYAPADVSAFPWPGAASRRHFFSAHDFFSEVTLPRVAPQGFTERLLAAGRNNSSRDRYTYYRMLAQLGPDAAVEDEDEGKININFVNVAGYRASDLVSWTNATPKIVADTGRIGPELFLLSVITNLLQRDLNYRTYVNYDPSTRQQQPLRIPIYFSGSRFAYSNGVFLGPLYSGRIHQVIQQAANIYDAVRGPGPLESAAFMFPTVFRPRFETDGSNNVFIVDYRMVTEPPSDIISFANNPARRWVDLDLGETPGLDNGVYNVPLIFGARKRIPNFNEFSSRTRVFAARRLLARKSVGETDITKFRFTETLSMAITNDFGMEALNSYRSPYPGQLEYYYSNEVTIGISSTFRGNSRIYPVVSAGTNYLVGTMSGWPAITFSNPPVASRLVFATNYIVDVDSGGTVDSWDIVVTNRVRYFLIDKATQRIIDAVAFSFTNDFFRAGELLADRLPDSNESLAGLWSRATSGKPWPVGIQHQLEISLGREEVGDQIWKDFGVNVSNKWAGIEAFKTFVASDTLTSNDVPFVAQRVSFQTNLWQVNDPLVHYSAEDLARTVAATNLLPYTSLPAFTIGGRNAGVTRPWPATPLFLSPGSAGADTRLRDPSIRAPDLWDFPTNKFPNIGWLGRVHRGTPWQTIYLKSRDVDLATWSGIGGASRQSDDLRMTRPVNDWKLMDIFTASIHPNASKGRLSINQTNLAAWSAVLSGAMTSIVTNDTSMTPPDQRPIRWTNEVVYPSSVSAFGEVEEIVASINATRGTLKNREFTTLGEVLRVPALSDESPFIRNSRLLGAGFDSARPPDQMDVFDEDYERLPQQLMSLLKVGEPRFVIYAWGQSLKPARLGFVAMDQPLSGPSIDPDTKLVNNYQVTGEVATRAVVRAVFPERESNNPADAGYFRPDYQRPRLVVESFNIIPLE